MEAAIPADPSPDALVSPDPAARWFGSPLPAACIEGVEVDLGVLAEHVAVVRSSLDEIGEASP